MCLRRSARRRRRPIRTTIRRASGGDARIETRCEEEECVKRPAETQRAHAEDLAQLLRRHHFELRISAIARASCRCATGETAQCGGNGCPACARRRLRPPARAAAAPTTDPCPGSSGSGRRACAGRLRRSPVVLGPLLSRVIGERVLAVWREEFDQFAALLLGETGANADVLQRAGIVVKSEQQRADRVPSPFLCQRKPATTQSQSRSCLTLSIDALVRLVDAR